MIRDVSFHVPAGARVAVVGPSGSGKSTLASLLLRYWELTDGRIRLGGTSLQDMAVDDARRLVTVVAQHDHLFDTTLRDNLSLGDQDADDDPDLGGLRRRRRRRGDPGPPGGPRRAGR